LAEISRINVDNLDVVVIKRTSGDVGFRRGRFFGWIDVSEEVLMLFKEISN
jgi:hypothetical protein